MIKELKIKNFKAHANTDIKMENLTVLTGINSSGKTSVIQSMLLLRQSFTKSRIMQGLDLNIPLCSVGIGNDVLYKYATEGVISFELTCDDNECFCFSYNCDESSLGNSFLNIREYSDNINTDALSKMSLFNNNFQYVSAARIGGTSIFPKDTYTTETTRQISLNNGQGELVAHFLYKFGSNDVTDYCNGETSDLSLISQSIYWEQKISPRVTFKVESGIDNNSFSILYGYNGSDNALKDLKAANVGYGISYSLAVIVALLSAKPGAMVIIENPEAHLHPSGQAEIAKLIAMVARNGIQVVVETHSDHIITGIQLACKEYGIDNSKGISNGDVAMYYFSVNDNFELDAERVNVGTDGILDYQPKGFFDRAGKKHLGEADLNGILDESKADGTKSLT